MYQNDWNLFQIEKTFEDALPPFSLENEVFSGKVPRFSREYVQVGPILDLVEPWTQTMQIYFNHPKERFAYVDKDKPGYSDFWFRVLGCWGPKRPSPLPAK